MPLFGKKKTSDEDVEKIQREVERILQETQLPFVETPSEGEVSDQNTPLPTTEQGTPVEQPAEEEQSEQEEIVEPVQEQQIQATSTVQHPKEKFAPLFVKVEKYRQLLDSMEDLKRLMATIKSALITLNEIGRYREENLKLLETTLQKIESKLISVDSEFLRPPGYVEQMKVPVEEVKEAAIITESLEGTLSEIQNQIQHIKSELQGV